MSYYGFISWVDSKFRTPANHNDGAQPDAGNAANAGNLDTWKVTWKKEGAKFGEATCGVAFGLIANFSVLPLMASTLAGGAAPGVTPAYMSSLAYAGGSSLGKLIGYQVGWYTGALVAEVTDLLEKISTKLFQLAKVLFHAAMDRLGYAAEAAADDGNAGAGNPPPRPPSPPPGSFPPDPSISEDGKGRDHAVASPPPRDDGLLDADNSRSSPSPAAGAALDEESLSDASSPNPGSRSGTPDLSDGSDGVSYSPAFALPRAGSSHYRAASLPAMALGLKV